jgi:succinate dehydrogenase / fumarate reductase cytochrome b subunit
MWAWALQRITGVGLVVYLILHFKLLASIKEGEEAFQATVSLYQHPIFKLAEIALLGAVLYHTINGLRVVAVDLGFATRVHKPVFWALMAVGVVIFAIGAYPFLLQITGK